MRRWFDPIRRAAWRGYMNTAARLHELSMIVQHKLTSGDNLLNNMDMGLVMFLKGKIHPLPKRIKGMDEVKALFEMGDEA